MENSNSTLESTPTTPDQSLRQWKKKNGNPRPIWTIGGDFVSIANETKFIKSQT